MTDILANFERRWSVWEQTFRRSLGQKGRKAKRDVRTRADSAFRDLGLTRPTEERK